VSGYQIADDSDHACSLHELTASTATDMVFDMKTTLIIPDSLFRQLKRKATERGETISDLVAEFIQKGLCHTHRESKLRRLPAFKCGKVDIDISNRTELYRVLDER